MVQLGNKVYDGGSGSWVNASRGLVEHEEMRLDGQGARNQHPLLLATRQRPERPLSQVSKTHLLQTVRCQLALLVGVQVAAVPAAHRCP